jgi:AcrR family transcriptional regulator
VNQKARTRAAIVEAATAMLRRGTPPTVTAAADEARVSRATAYRYFPTQEALLVEVADVSPAVAVVEETLGRQTAQDPEARLLELVDTLSKIVLAEEVSMRHALRVYLDTWLESRGSGRGAPPVREGRRMRWLDETLEAVRRQLPEARWRRLRAALALTLGADAMVVMKDVCLLDDDAAREVLRWAAAAMLRAGLEEARPQSRSPRTRVDDKPTRGERS